MMKVLQHQNFFLIHHDAQIYVTDGSEWFYKAKATFTPHSLEVSTSPPLTLKISSNDGKSILLLGVSELERLDNSNKNSLGPLFLLVANELQRSIQECDQLKKERENDIEDGIVSRDIPSPISALNVTVAKRTGSSLINPRVKKQTGKSGKKLAFSDEEDD